MSNATSELTLAHLNLDVAELARSRRFYEDVLALPVVRNGDSLSIRSAGFIIVLKAGRANPGGTFHFGFRVANEEAVDEWFARFASLDVAIVESPTARGMVYVGRIHDPDNYPIEIYAERSGTFTPGS